MKKRLLALACAALLALGGLVGCQAGPADSEESKGSSSASSTTSQPSQKTTLRVAAIQGPTGIGLANLMEKNSHKLTQNDYQFEVFSSPEEVKALILNGDVDIASVPTNVAAALFNKTEGALQMLALNTGCVLTLMENGTRIKSIADLKGKTIYSTGQGANPEYVLRYILEKNGINPDKDVTLSFLTDNTDLAARMVSGKIEVALVPQPVATSVLLKSETARVALNVSELWEKAVTSAGDTAAGSRVMMGCVVAKKSFIDSHQEAIKLFLAEYEDSVNAVSDAKSTGALCEKYNIIANAAMATKAIPSCEITFIKGAAMKPAVGGYFDILASYNAKSVGGKVPTDAFYYVEAA